MSEKLQVKIENGSPEEKMPERPKKKSEIGSPEEKMPERPKKKSEIGSSEEKMPERPKKKSEIGSPEEKMSERPKKKGESGSPEEKMPERPKKKSEIGSLEEKMSERPKKKSESGSPEEKMSERPKKKGETGSPEEKMSERPKVGNRREVSQVDKQYAKVEYMDFSGYERIIVLSDIHGDYDGFRSLLDKVNFTDRDALVIVGDILEKGSQSLKLLRMIMQYTEAGNLFMTAGNNDVIFSEWYEGDITDEAVLWYVNSRENSAVIEMAEELKLEYKTLEDIKTLKLAMKEAFQKEFQFLQELPDILESPAATFVHAGIKPGDLNKQPYSYCLTAPAFAEQTHHFEKKVIVGHWPVSNYRNDIINANPYFNTEANVISIDGGNSMKRWKQINYLILSSDGAILESGYYDNLPQIKALDDQAETSNPITLTFPNTRIEVKCKSEKQSICYIPYIDRELPVDNDRIYEYKRNTYCSDFTTYCLSVEAGEILAFCGETKDGKDGVLVKRDGIVGNYRGRYEWIG